tara:strand:- start:82811 stop:86212 length:3402 start_codon:yes stop_codon:yes gene_type:complete
MKKSILLAFVLCANLFAFAQNEGDTIVVKTFNYNSTSRDTTVQFPAVSGATYQKILMQYSMRCKDGKVSNSTNRNLGCGEWDYSCNTYITDSAHVDSVIATTPSHSISGYAGTSYPYTISPYFNKYQFTQTSVSQTVINETKSVINAGTITMNDAIATDENSGRSQYLYTQSDLSRGGVTTGLIDGIFLTAQNSSSAKFLRVRVKSTTHNTLDAVSADTTGFTQVYFSDYSFATGSNRIQFYTPFNWDGTSNLIFEFSFTNSTQNTALSLTGETTTFNAGLVANNQYHINTSAGNYLNIPVTNFTGMGTEISVTFWAKGNTGVGGTKTVTLFGSDSDGNKTINIHLPWNNSQVYWDCGNTGTSVDRINTPATSAELENWNHWAFTKNATTGTMNIYLNGVLFKTGSGKTKSFDITSLTFGGNYGGKLDELRIWKKELTPTEIQDWMNKSIDNSHPQYGDLVAYYPLNEGTGNTATDLTNGSIVASFNGAANWEYERGSNLNRFFTESTNRPNLSIAQGNYTLTTTAVTVTDSLQMVPNTVTEYQIFPKPGTLHNDSIGEINQWTYWLATNKYVYDGVTGSVISTTPITSDGTVNITNLNYYKRSASDFEIMSFVTPYGIGLDLGMAGKTWTFDVTDYTPFLNGSKRIFMNKGGQWQEDIDITFLFIVGTPERDVVDVEQIWKVNAINYAQLLDDTYFAPRDVMMHPNGKAFKIRSMITGHGQEGEFIPRTHSIVLNTGAPTFSWQVWKTCGNNPVYPQGGTWIYDRAGWCPGMATALHEEDITNFVTPGQTTKIDYDLASATGTSRYILNHQLVSYGDANHAIDASISDIISPSNKVEYARQGQTCISPTIVLRNSGSTALTKATILYWVNDGAKKEYKWTGNLAFQKTQTIVLPTDAGFWFPVSGLDNVFYAQVLNPNDATDENGFNNTFSSPFSVPEVMPESFIVKFKTNSKGSENSYQIIDDQGTVVFSKANMASNTTYKDTVNLGFGCYKMKVMDTGGNGINFWANSDGAGYIQLWKIGAGIAKIIQPDFGNEITFNFTTGTALAVEEFAKNAVFKVYPNPAKNFVTIEGTKIEDAKVFIYNVMGLEMALPAQFNTNKMVINTQNLSTGVYFVNIMYQDYSETKTIIIE